MSATVRRRFITRLLCLCGIAALLGSARTAEAQSAEESPGLGLTLGPVDMSLHGFLRAPFRFSWKERQNPSCTTPTGCGSGSYDLHSPFLVDDDYFRSGFAYTRIQEQDYAELFFNVGNKYVTGTVAIMGSLYSDWARPLLDNQLGIAQGYLTFKWEKDTGRLKIKAQAKAGAFWDRFGWLQSYDTYMFGRTHQLGAQGRLQIDVNDWSLWALYGFGAHLEAIDLNEGLSFLNYAHVGASWKERLTLGFYVLDSFTHDKRQLSPIDDADETVVGLDASFRHPLAGRFYLAGSFVGATKAEYLAPAIEVMHSFGGRGLTDNFLGNDHSDHGTGSLANVAFEYAFSLKALLDHTQPKRTVFSTGDLSLKIFGLYSYVSSHQVDKDPMLNKDQRQYFKWGVEPTWQALSWLALAVRYDRVILDLDDDANSFRVISPKLMITTHWLLDAQIFFQYSHYVYGARVLLRPGQVLMQTLPDPDVFKVQAQIVF